MCKPEKPNYILTEIAVQSNDLLRLQATFVMDKVKYVPFGNLRFQELELKLISREFETVDEYTNKLLWKVKDFNDIGKSSNATMYNLIKKGKTCQLKVVEKSKKAHAFQTYKMFSKNPVFFVHIVGPLGLRPGLGLG